MKQYQSARFIGRPDEPSSLLSPIVTEISKKNLLWVEIGPPETKELRGTGVNTETGEIVASLLPAIKVATYLTNCLIPDRNDPVQDSAVELRISARLIELGSQIEPETKVPRVFIKNTTTWEIVDDSRAKV